MIPQRGYVGQRSRCLADNALDQREAAAGCDSPSGLLLPCRQPPQLRLVEVEGGPVGNIRMDAPDRVFLLPFSLTPSVRPRRWIRDGQESPARLQLVQLLLQAFAPTHPIPATRRTRTADSSEPAPRQVVRCAVHAQITEAVILTHPVPMLLVISSRPGVSEVEGWVKPWAATFREGDSRQPQGLHYLNRPLLDCILITRPQQHGHHDTLEPVRVLRSGPKVSVTQAIPKLSHTMGVHRSPPLFFDRPYAPACSE